MYNIIADEHVVGNVSFHSKGDEHFWIGCIAVIPEYQDKGIGSKTIKYLETEYPDAKIWELETPVQNYRNCRFYEKCGFVKADEKVHSEKITLRIYKKIVTKINSRKWALNKRKESNLVSIIRANEWFMSVLHAVRACNPPDWFVGAGVIRNIVWDYLHNYHEPTALSDVDVIFFDPNDLSPARDQFVQKQLYDNLPNVLWEATNQAAVHLWYEKLFGYPVPALKSCEEAIGTWPETATSIGVRLLANDELLFAAPFGLEDLFNMILRRNSNRITVELFRQRVQEKAIQYKWPKVRIIDS
jgi:hypothetical protein